MTQPIVSVDTEEIKNAIEKLSDFGARKATTMMRTAINAGGREMRKEWREKIWIDHIRRDRRALKVTRLKYLPKGIAVSWVTPVAEDAHILRFHEFGYNLVATGRYAAPFKKRLKKTTRPGLGRSRKDFKPIGRVRARPMMRPGFESGVAPTTAVVRDRLLKDIEKVWVKLGKR